VKLNRFYFNSVRIAIETFFVTFAFITFFNNVRLLLNRATVTKGIFLTLLILVVGFAVDVLFGLIADGITDRKSAGPQSILRGVAAGTFAFATLTVIAAVFSAALAIV
jgi:hypothetical protein